MATAKPAVKMPKLPKSLGACADKYHETRTLRLAEEKVAAATKAVEDYIKEHIINNLPKGDTGAVGRAYKAITYNDTVFVVKDWPKFYRHLQKTGEFDLLNRALNQAAVKERIEAQTRPSGKRGEGWKPKLPPGVEAFPIVKLSVTKK